MDLNVKSFTDENLSKCFNIIAHLDMDAFYAQVECKRLNLSAQTPLAVEQWGSIIAANYKAKSFGVKRGIKSSIAKLLCSSIVIVHVEVIGAIEESSSCGFAPRRNEQKVSLKRYREASEHVLKVISEIYGSNIEKISIDEVYINLSNSVKHMWRDLYEKLVKDHAQDKSKALCIFNGAFSITALEKGAEFIKSFSNLKSHFQSLNDPSTYNLNELSFQMIHKIMKDDNLNAKIFKQFSNDIVSFQDIKWSDIPMILGCISIYKCRQIVYSDTGLTCSAGIARNKFLAKELSAKFKPNEQTVVLDSFVDSMLKQILIRDARGFRGKLGKLITESLPNVKTLFDLKSKSHTELWNIFAEKDLNAANGICRLLKSDIQSLLYNKYRNLDQSKFKQNTHVNSMLSCKTFPSIFTYEEFDFWIPILCRDLANRLEQDFQEHKRIPNNFVVQLTGGQPVQKNQSRSVKHSYSSKLRNRFTTGDLFPCTRLGVGVGSFKDVKQKSILSYVKTSDENLPMLKPDLNSNDSLKKKMKTIYRLEPQDNGRSKNNINLDILDSKRLCNSVNNKDIKHRIVQLTLTKEK